MTYFEKHNREYLDLEDFQTVTGDERKCIQTLEAQVVIRSEIRCVILESNT